MRKIKAINIEGREKPVTVRELRVKDILALFGEEKDLSIDNIRKFLDLSADITLDELKDLAPSEIKVIWDVFREVNEVFFEVARAVGMGQVVDELKQSIVQDFARQLAA